MVMKMVVVVVVVVAVRCHLAPMGRKTAVESRVGLCAALRLTPRVPWFPIPGQVSENDEFLFLGCDGVFELYSSEALTLPYAAVCKFAYPDSGRPKFTAW